MLNRGKIKLTIYYTPKGTILPDTQYPLVRVWCYTEEKYLLLIINCCQWTFLFTSSSFFSTHKSPIPFIFSRGENWSLVCNLKIKNVSINFPLSASKIRQEIVTKKTPVKSTLGRKLRLVVTNLLHTNSFHHYIHLSPILFFLLS